MVLPDVLDWMEWPVSGTLAPLYTVFGLKLGCSRAVAPIGDEGL